MGLESVEAAAAGIVDIVNENMLGGLRLVSVQQGFDPREFALVAFGGAGPLHANALGKLTGAWPVIVPPSPGVLCALGDATTSARNESARTCLRRFADLDADDLRRDPRRASRPRRAGRWREQGVPVEQQTTAYQVDVRYLGQGFEIPIDVDPAAGPRRRSPAAFDAEHERLFSFLLTRGPRAGERPRLGDAGRARRSRRSPSSPATGRRRRATRHSDLRRGRLGGRGRSTTAPPCGPAT